MIIYVQSNVLPLYVIKGFSIFCRSLKTMWSRSWKRVTSVRRNSSKSFYQDKKICNIFDPFWFYFSSWWEIWVEIQFSQHHLVKSISFFKWKYLTPLPKIRWLSCFWIFYSVPLILGSVYLFICLFRPVPYHFFFIK